MNNISYSHSMETINPTLQSGVVSQPLKPGVPSFSQPVQPPSDTAASLKSFNSLLVDPQSLGTNGVEFEDLNVSSLAETPLLKPPVAQSSDDLTSSKEKSSLYQLLVELQQILGDMSIDELNARLKMIQQVAGAKQANLEEISKELEIYIKKYDDDLKKRDQARDDLNGCEEAVKKSQDAYKKAQDRFAQAEADLSMNPDDKDLQDIYNQAASALKVASDKLDSDQNSLAKAQSAKFAVENEVSNDEVLIGRTLEKLDQLMRDSDIPQSVLSATDAEKGRSSAAQLTFLMMQLSDIIGKYSEDDLKSKMELFKQRQDALLIKLEKSAKDFKAAVEKAAKISKIFGIFGKILGALVVAVSVVTAILPGAGALSVGFAAVGVALLTSDILLEALGKKTLSDVVLGPIMDVVGKLVMSLGEVFSKALQNVGVSKEVADIIGNIAAGLTVVAAAVVAVVVGKGAVASRLAGQFASKVAAGLAKVSPQILKEVASSVGNIATKFGEKLSDRFTTAALQKSVVWAQRGAVVVEAIGNGVVQPALAGAQGAAEQKQFNAVADMKLDDAMIKQITKLCDKLIETSSNIFTVSRSLAQTSASIIQSNGAAGARILSSNPA